jgi:hypothetical protein
MSEFSDQYKHPKWQKLRLEMLEAAQFECSKCGDTESQLHVHHRHYVKGRKVWDYGRCELEVLCSACHAEEHSLKGLLSDVLACADSPASYETLIPLVHGLVNSYVVNDPRIGVFLEVYNFEYTVGQILGGHHDHSYRDLMTILSLDPDQFRELAESVRSKNRFLFSGRKINVQG